MRDLLDQRTVMISKNAVCNGGLDDGSPGFPSLSADGSVSSFVSVATNAAAVDTNGAADVFFVHVPLFEDGFESGDLRFWSGSLADRSDRHSFRRSDG